MSQQFLLTSHLNHNQSNTKKHSSDRVTVVCKYANAFVANVCTATRETHLCTTIELTRQSAPRFSAIFLEALFVRVLPQIILAQLTFTL